MDTSAILAAVREVPGVRDAILRRDPGGGQTLRLDLTEAADPRIVEREVAALLRDRLGVNATPAPPPSAAPTSPPSSDSVGSAESAPDRARVGDPPAKDDGVPTDTETNGDVLTAPSTDGGRGPGGAIVASADTGDTTRDTAVPDTAVPAAAEYTPDHVTADYVGAGAVAATHRRTDPMDRVSKRVVLERVQVVTAGLEAAVEVGLAVGGIRAVGRAAGPAVEEHVLRAAAAATTDAVDVLLAGRARCAMEHVGTYHASTTEVALVVVMLLSAAGPERLTGAAAIDGDARQAAARATLAALNRRLAALLP